MVFQLHGKRGYLALHVSGTVNVLQVAHQFLARSDKLLRRRGHHAAKRCHPLERLTAPDAVVEPQLHVIIGLSALVRIEEQQVLQVGGELAGGFAVGLACCARFAGEGIEQHGALAVFRRNHAALGAQKHVARCLLGRYAGGQAQDILGRQGQREGAAGFDFGSMSLVNHPVAYRRQQPPVGSQVAEQQAVVRYHDIRALGAAAGAVHETRRAEIGTLTAQAVMAGRGDGETRERAVVYLQAVHVVVLGLLDVREQRSERRCLRLLLAGNEAHARSFDGQAVDLPQTWVMGESLERGIGEPFSALTRGISIIARSIPTGDPRLGKRGTQRRQLMVNKLVEQGVGLRRNTHGDIVLAGRQRCRNQVRHRLSHTRTGLHHEVFGSGESGTHGLGHCQLLGARLEVAIESSHQPFGGESGSDLLVRGECQIAEGVGRYGIGIRLRLAVELRHTFTAQGAQREALACCLGCWFFQFIRLTCAYDTIIAAFASEIIEHDLGWPLLGHRHARDLAHERHGHRSDSRQEDAEDGTGGLDIGIGPMRRERGAERLHQIEQTVRLQTRERDARKVERIDPCVLQQRVATGMPGGERAVELGIVRDDFRVPHEFRQFR